MVDRKIVELLIGGMGLNAIGRSLHVAKRRIRALRERAKVQGYLEEDGQRGPTALPPYPEAIFPDPVDGRSLRVSEAYRLLAPHEAWIRERLEAGWHAVTVFEELPEELKEVSRSSFYRYLERHALNRLGERDRVVPEIRHAPGEALILDWGKLRDVIDPVTGRKAPLWMFIGVLGFSRFMLVRLVWTMDTTTTLQAIEGMLRTLGGVPCKVTIDNPKCIALEASKYEPLLNPAVERFASHYGVLFECLPPADPQKKGKVERQVPYGRRLYEAHGDTWLGLEESQRYLDRKVARPMNAGMGPRSVGRRTCCSRKRRRSSRCQRWRTKWSSFTKAPCAKMGTCALPTRTPRSMQPTRASRWWCWGRGSRCRSLTKASCWRCMRGSPIRIKPRRPSRST
jgi:transposase